MPIDDVRIIFDPAEVALCGLARRWRIWAKDPPFGYSRHIGPKEGFTTREEAEQFVESKKEASSWD